MKKTSVFGCILIMALLSVCVSLGDDITTVKGSTYSNVRVTGTDGLGIKVMHKTGVAYIPYKDMTDSDKTKWGYQPKKEAEILAERQRQIELAECAKREAEKKKIQDDEKLKELGKERLAKEKIIEQEEEAKKQALAKQEEELKNAYRFNGEVLQVLSDGVLFKGKMLTYPEFKDAKSKQAIFDKMTEEREKLTDVKKQIDVMGEQSKLLRTMPIPSECTCFIAGIKERLADGDDWKGFIYYAGLYQYTNVMGATKTIRAYATSKELAEKIFK
jgi:hypothetical protein